MTEIALYNTLRKIPEVSDDEAKEAVADVASSREVATKADIAELKADIAEIRAETKADIAELKAETKTEIARVEKTISELETKLTKLIYTVIALNTGVIIAAVGLMIRFL